MRRNTTELQHRVFDLLVIGGGIFGAGVARDAALRGLSVALLEMGDFASGTSSESSKLIHGGFRYLEQRDFGLVAEASRERRILLEIAPHRVKPLPLLLPVYEGSPRPLWLLRLGMTLYDLLALYRNVEPHRTLRPEAALELEPSLRPDHLLGAIRFFDCQEDDARFCIDNVIHAAELGAICANYCEVTALRTESDRIVAASVRDRINCVEFDARAKVFINAAGPWIEKVASLMPAADPLPTLSPTKGVHVLLPPMTRTHGIFFQSGRDARMMFALPWNQCTLLGTTDTDYGGDPGAAHPEAADIQYLLQEARTLCPGVDFQPHDVIATTTGVRPLLQSDHSDPSSRTREHKILRRGENLLSLAGGKYTTYRLIAQQAVDAAYGLLGGKPAPCKTGVTPIPDRRPLPAGEKIADCPEVYASDVEHAVREEMALTAHDVMRRRTGLSLSRFRGKEVEAKVAHIVSETLRKL